MKIMKRKNKVDKKKRAFTLIELLAVILILGVVALIAVPSVTNIVDEARQGAAERSAENYISAVDNQLAANLMNTDSSDDLSDGTYTLPLDEKYKVKVKGSTPKSGWIEIINNAVDKYSLVMGDYTVSYDGTNKTVTKTEKGREETTIIYRVSGDLLFVGDKIDLENWEITSYTKYKNYSKQDYTHVATNQTYTMEGIYSTDINDVLNINDTVDMGPDSRAISFEDYDNGVYFKDTVNKDGIIKKIELCSVTSWGTLCKEAYSTYDSTNSKWVNPKYDEQVAELFNFYKWNKITSTSSYNNVQCNDFSSDAYCAIGNISDSIRNNGFISVRDSIFVCEIEYGGSYCRFYE